VAGVHREPSQGKAKLSGVAGATSRGVTLFLAPREFDAQSERDAEGRERELPPYGADDTLIAGPGISV